MRITRPRQGLGDWQTKAAGSEVRVGSLFSLALCSGLSGGFSCAADGSWGASWWSTPN